MNPLADSDCKCYGGAIYIHGDNSVTFSNCTFFSNLAIGKCGAIYMNSGSSYLTLKNNHFYGNMATVDDEGSCVYTYGHFKDISNNYWHGETPSSDNNLLIEHISIFPNKHHEDSNPH